jgi:glycosyltransferase involved in cell wall biosynthesis
VLELASALRRDRRIEPIVAAPVRGELTHALECADVECVVAPAPTWLVDESPPWPDDPLRGVRRARRVLRAVSGVPSWSRLLRDRSVDVVVSSTTTSPTVAVACRRNHVPHVWWVHEFTTLDHHRRYALGERLSQRLMGWLSAQVAVNSPAVARHYSPPIAPGKVRVVDLGVEPPLVPENDITPHRLRVLVLGRLAPGKGCDLAIRAVALLVAENLDVTLRFVGPTLRDYSEQLWYLARDLGVLEHVEFMEYVEHPHEQLAWSNVLVMNSEAEAFGRVTIEALKSGRPVVGARAGATAHLVDHGQTGLLFEPGDVEGLASMLRTCIDDAQAVATMSTNARKATADRFTMQHEVDEFVGIFNEVARRHD